MSIKREVNIFTKRLQKTINVAAGNKRLLTQVGRIAARLIKRRTRNGFGVSQPGANAERLKRLSQAYVSFRSNSRDLSSETTPGKSNLTFTGVLLNSLRVVKADSQKREVTVDASRRRRRGGLTNEKVAEFVSEQGREFLNLSRREITQVTRSFNRSYREQFKKSVRSQR